VRSLRAFDRAPPMVQRARLRLAEAGHGHCTVEIADNAQLPLPGATADLAVAGWTFGHQTVWEADGGRQAILAALAEMNRVLRPGGTAIVVETLGTGHTAPFDPPPALAAYYQLLTDELGYRRDWIRTDYAFPTLAEGERLLRFFFGDDVAARYLARGDLRMPECTGLWSRRQPK